VPVATVKNYGDEFLDWYRNIIALRLTKAAAHLHNRIKEKLSLTGVGFAVYTHEREEIAGQFRSGKLFTRTVLYKKRQRIYGFVRSLPGEPPRKQTGDLRSGVTYEVDQKTLVARVGVYGPATKYAKFLELGTSKMKARPFLRITAWEEKPTVEKILAGEYVSQSPQGFGRSSAGAAFNAGSSALNSATQQ
jgi:HK97 gp10 family phage protein